MGSPDEAVAGKLDTIIGILSERSERLDRFEAAIAALGKGVGSQAVIRLDRCSSHVHAPGGTCVTCVMEKNEELQRQVEHLTTGARLASDMLARSNNVARGVAQAQNLLIALFSPKVVANKCKFCGVTIENILEKGAKPTGGGVWGYEGFVYDKNTLEGEPGFVCYPCSFREFNEGVQAPAPSEGGHGKETDRGGGGPPPEDPGTRQG